MDIMKQNKLISTLKDLGLSDDESEVYYAALSLGPSTVLKISKTAGVKRTTTYRIIDSLQHMGLMRVEVAGLKKLYAAEDPARLVNILEARKEKVESVLGEFSALYNLKGGESFVKYYEGVEAVKSVYESVLKRAKAGDYYYAVGDVDRWYDMDRDFFDKYMLRRFEVGLAIKLILRDSHATREYDRKKKPNEEMKYMPKDSKISTSIGMTEHMTFFHQVTEPVMAIVIENKSINLVMKEMFDIMWDALP